MKNIEVATIKSETEEKADEMKKTGLDMISLLLTSFDSHCKVLMNRQSQYVAAHSQRDAPVKKYRIIRVSAEETPPCLQKP
jgi:hypothetical protein